MRGLREPINKNQPLIMGAVILLVLIAVCITYRSLWGGGSKTLKSAFYTVDDGKTWFKDDIDRVSPFMVDGKEAVTTLVFSCNGKPFVGALRKWTPEAKKILDAAYEAKLAGKTLSKDQMDLIDRTRNDPNASLVKAPADKEWMHEMQADAAVFGKIAKCPNGKDVDYVYADN